MTVSLKIVGFSLIELLVVLAILILSIAIVPPIFSNVIDGARIKSATRELASGLRQTRLSAIATRHEVSLRFNVESAMYTVEGQTTELKLPIDTHITFTTATSELESTSTGSILFFADGSSTGGRFIMKGAGQQYTIDVDWLTGRITIRP